MLFESAMLAGLLKRISKKQLLSIVDSPSRRIALWSGSVSAGKTFASLIAFLLAVRNAPTNGLIVIVGNSLDTIYTNVFTQLMNAELFGSNVVSQIKYTPGATKAYILGREIILVGANNAASVKRIQGKTIGLVYVDEATLLLEPFWDMLITRLRVEGARLLGTMNPASMNHWLRKKWILDADRQDVIHFPFTMLDNPSLPGWYVEQMKRSFAGVFYDRMILGKWTNAAGAVYPMWDPARHIIQFDQMPRIERVVGVGIDYGTSNASAALMVGLTSPEQGKKRSLILMDEWRYDPRDHNGVTMAPSDQAKQYVKWLASKHTPYEALLDPEYHVVDPAASHFSAELRKFPDLQLANASNAVLKGIGTVSGLLANDQLKVVGGRCAGFESEITEYRWDAKATEAGHDEVVKEDDHSLDAGRYGIHTTRSSWQYELDAA
ncbi:MULTISPECIES: PBSX family phage terminase large subunit [unclassified Cryobacterium]|uniref:PBSX family phage terminase large subunit n=1 Tax=unclassified Cryobacterium TaxID=2649013 RepID=UPI002AB4A21B|nr:MULTISPECIES: PBSX family phage terminase large subunit [unclassified Cryobacterium]MDY7542613.1 PBSX family phage terminase large subunit [Cryobacterium sp. 5B3]MEB0264733.1 PBSX family phage terminase large subunit [Cryobacterium sp. 10I5]MEB0273705.1 PBSX family phage terminase large subunit [Cryobacterium sp. 5B3]